MELSYESYESSPALPHLPPQPSSSSLAPPRAESEHEDEEEEPEPEGEGEEVEEVEDDQPKKPTKRPIKQRQSLAEKQPGTTLFPISRVKRIIKADKDLDMMTGEACFMISVATEYFVKHFMEEGYTKARLDKRRIVNYRDMAAVVTRSEEFDFLKDIVPMPMPISEALERRKQKLAMDDNPTLHDDLAPPNLSRTKPRLSPKTSLHSVITGKNAPSTPHSLTTRGSARRSLAATDATQEEETITTLRAEAEVRHDDGDDVAAGDAEDVEPMDED
ncbi:hypothetical protein EHS25_009738 [Saitozyma podzolica]|uniref:Transcription factor CBF/NF-Y/archaeal histone domain-containing protein n=1 Tax=Saitozyma podzolica TaxID=1890683 RepID=A0A427YK54_9TREE|nr:hypothetical protein EHS25_009738 [Saitozyma podzolica]